MQRIPQNYLSDFPFVETFYKYDASNELVVDKIPDSVIDFEFVYRAEDHRTFVAGRRGGEYFNCKPLGEASVEVHIPLSRHPLGCGELLHELRLYAPNGDFPEGVQQLRIPARTGYVLHKGASAPMSAVSRATAIAAAILAGKSAYELAVENGFAGTEEDYVKAPVKAIAALSSLQQTINRATAAAEDAEQQAAAAKVIVEKGTGNTINISELYPPTEGFHTLESAAEAVPVARRSCGRLITFQAAESSWQTYQYVGPTAEEDDWVNPANWKLNGSDSFVEGTNIRIEEQADGTYQISATRIDVIDDLDSDDSDAAASARLAKVLNGKILDLEGRIPDGFTIGEDGYLYLTQNGETIGDGVKLPEGGGGGGGGSSSTLTVKITSGTNVSLLYGAPCIVSFNFASVDTNGDETGDGTAQYYVGSTLVATRSIPQGQNSFDFGPYLAENAEQKLRVRVEDQDGNIVNRSVTVTTVTVGLSTSYAISTLNSGPIEFPFTPSGTGDKTVYFELDGEVIATQETSKSNRELTQTIPAQAHGCHTLRLWMEVAFPDGTTIRSNTVTRDLVCIEPGNNSPVVAISYETTAGKQFDVFVLRYVVYNPTSAYSDVVLAANGSTVMSLNVSRSVQTWNYQLPTAGDMELSVTSDAASRSVQIAVEESDIDVEAAPNAALALTAANRSNNEQNPARWLSDGKDTGTVFTGFNWQSDGWLNNGRYTSLHLSGTARLHIPFEVFGSDFRTNGGVVEFEFMFSNVADYQAEGISCYDAASGIGLVIRPNDFTFSSSAETVGGKIKEDERVRVSFVIEPKIGYRRLLYVFINGYICGVRQYSDDALFTQTKPVGISVGSSDCDIYLYNIRVYNRYLTDRQLLENLICDMDNPDEKLEVFSENQLLNTAETEIDYNKLVEQIPCLTITGELPALKDTSEVKYSTKVDLEFVHGSDPSKSFTAEGVKLSVQGTSSQYYPRKNYKIKFSNGLTAADGSAAAKYALKDGAIPVGAFCLKADFAESSSTHNTGAARLIHDLLTGCGILSPIQAAHPAAGYRTTIDGYPIAVFHKASANSPRTLLGKYNFNNDKGTHETYGFVQQDGTEWPNGTFAPECWEFCNNTSQRCLFQISDFGDGWLEDFEARFPEDNTNFANLKAVCDALAATYITPADSEAVRAQKLAAFRKVIEQRFDLDNILSYYVLRETLVMADQGAKNCMLASWDGERWYWIFYDNDTILGVNNSGLISFEYDVEPHDNYSDAEGSSKVFNGEGSVIWTNLELAYPEQIKAMYGRLRSQAALFSYEAAIRMFDDEQMRKWAATVYNEDARFKYIDNGTTSYLGQAEGPRQLHRHRWLYNRFRYLDSKYAAGDFLGDSVTFRVNYPSGNVAVPPTGTIYITALMAQYFAVRWGANSAIAPQRVAAEATGSFPAPAAMLANLNDIETTIYGASRIASFGDLSPLYPGSVDVSKATMLQELIIGNATPGYENPNLSTADNKAGVVLGANVMLRKFDIRNCSHLAQNIDMSGCTAIEEVYAGGSQITGVTLAAGTRIRVLQLPASVTSIVLRSQAALTYHAAADDGLQLAGLGNILQLVVENCDGIDPFRLVQNIFAGTNSLTYVRLSGVSGSADDISLLTRLSQLKGLDADLNITQAAVLEGRYSAAIALSDAELQLARRLYVDLQITVSVIADTKLETINGEAFEGAPEFSALTSQSLDEALKQINGTDEETDYATYESALRLIEQGIYSSLTDLEIELMEINATAADTDYERINAALALMASGEYSTLAEAMETNDNYINSIRI